MPAQHQTKRRRKTSTEQLKSNSPTKGVIFTSKHKENCSFVIGFEGRVYKMSGFSNYINAKLARLNMLIIFKPEHAITEIKMLIKSINPIVTSELRSQLSILLNEAEGKTPERVKIKSEILKPIFYNVNEQKYLAIRDTQNHFERAYKAADQNTATSAPMIFSSMSCAAPQPSASPQLSDIPELPEDILAYVQSLETPNREYTSSGLSFGSEFQLFRSTPELSKDKFILNLF